MEKNLHLFGVGKDCSDKTSKHKPLKKKNDTVHLIKMKTFVLQKTVQRLKFQTKY